MLASIATAKTHDNGSADSSTRQHRYLVLKKALSDFYRELKFLKDVRLLRLIHT